jgi:hypothetical protein
VALSECFVLVPASEILSRFEEAKSISPSAYRAFTVVGKQSCLYYWCELVAFRNDCLMQVCYLIGDLNNRELFVEELDGLLSGEW